MTVRFSVEGEPRGKGRPRFARGGQVYTPRETAAYERAIAQAYRGQCGGVRFERDVPLRLCVAAYFAVPKSAGKRARCDMLTGRVRPGKRPDFDNVAKVVADALGGVAYHDDAQIVDAVVHKLYAECPRVEVELCEAGRTPVRDKAVQERAIETVKGLWRWYVDEYYPDESWDETMGYILDAVESANGEKKDDSSQNNDA